MIRHFFVTVVPDDGSTGVPADAIDLTDPTKFGTIEFDGLYRPTADDFITELGGVDASYFSGMTLKQRDIKVNMDAQNSWYRMMLYRALPYGTMLRIWIATDIDTYWIDGYVVGLPGGSSDSDMLSNMDVTFRCPYPWFRSMRAHEKIITPFFRSDSYENVTLSSGELYHLEQDGDIDAGVMIFVEELTNPGAGSTYGDLTGLYDSTGNYIKTSPVWRINTTGQIDYSNGETKVLDTTPGEMWWADLVSTTGGELLPSSIDFNGSAITVTPQTGVDIGFAFLNYVDLRSNYTVTARWYDTWSGI